jgi:hypothetical protein
MDMVLVSITALSLILAIAMGAILFTVLREDRRRSDARVAALAAASATFDPPVLTRELAAEPDVDVILRSPDDLFSSSATSEPSPWGRRAAVAAVLVMVLAGAGYALLPAKSTEPSAPQAARAQVLPLELLALSHTQQPSGLTITGTVYNPRGAAPLAEVTATAVLFGSDGSVLTTARAPLDFTTLAPGGESPFVISAPVAAAVARYRVGFRGADGTVIAHIDRRVDGTAAQNAAPGGTPWAH